MMCPHGCGTELNASGDEEEQCSPRGPYMKSEEHTPERCRDAWKAKCEGSEWAGDPSKWSHAAQIDGLAQQRDAVEAKYDRYREEADVLREKLATVEAMLEERKDPGADYAWGWKDRALAAEAKLAEAEAKLAEAEPVALAEAKLYRYRKEVDVLQAKLLVAQEALEYIDNTDDENNVAAQAMRSVASGALEQIS